jgi:hypothetical protein
MFRATNASRLTPFSLAFSFVSLRLSVSFFLFLNYSEYRKI